MVSTTRAYVRPSYRRTSTGWAGVLRDERGLIVWECPHVHRNRDWPDNFLGTGCARICAEEEARRREEAGEEVRWETERTARAHTCPVCGGYVAPGLLPCHEGAS
ncbi:MAG TPA: hypothetical protein VNO79_15290 [Actinomycetota bacterium]|nr:hypothetical protein [Actinomycetota bacterium]